MRDAGEIERGVTVFVRKPNGGLIVTGTALAFAHHDLIIALANRHRLPAVYWHRQVCRWRRVGSYGPDTVDPFRRAAGYVDRILKGEKPADLPVQAPTKYDLAINLKAARAIGIEFPTTVIARRRGDRSIMHLCQRLLHLLRTAYGTKRTSQLR